MGTVPQTLDAIGLSFNDEVVYRAVLKRPGGEATELEALVDLPPVEVRRTIRRLEAAGLIGRAPGSPVRYVPAPPESAVAPLILRRQQELLEAQEAVDRVRHSATLLQREYLSALQVTNPLELVEVIQGPDAVLQRDRQLQASSRRVVRAMSVGEWTVAPGDPLNPAQVEAMSRGVEFRAVYAREYVETPGAIERIEEYVRTGEVARVINDLRVRMTIVDDEVALVPLVAGMERAVVVHRSALLDALEQLFERTWALATPVMLGSDGAARVKGTRRAVPAVTRRILTMLAAGSKDEAIARQLGLSLTTVRRRIAAAMEELEGETRFQAGVQAARRGWL